MRPADSGPRLPELPGVLTGDQVRTTVSWIAGQQDADGALPWFRGGQLDPWDSVEAAMALDLGGEHDRPGREAGGDEEAALAGQRAHEQLEGRLVLDAGRLVGGGHGELVEVGDERGRDRAGVAAAQRR